MLDAVAVAEDLRKLGHRLRKECGVFHRRDLERRRFCNLEPAPWKSEHDATAATAAALCGCFDLTVRARSGREHDGDCGDIWICVHKDSHQLRITNYERRPVKGPYIPTRIARATPSSPTMTSTSTDSARTPAVERIPSEP